jgi:RNA polymerase sigma factor (sigma-70 family)
MRFPSVLSDWADPDDSFRRLFDISYRPLLAYALRRGASRADAEEVVADTLLVAWRRRDEVPAEPEALPWLYAVARRVLANQRRARVRRRRLERLLGAPPSVADLFEEAELAEEARALIAASRRLSEADQEVLRLAAWEGLSHSEIGRSLGCSENAAALRLHRARLRLREALVKEARAAGQEVVEVKR